jgi:hypothetical protein
MSVQTRSDLQASAATITNETAAGANTASRVGGLFDDLADTATLDRERGFANLYLDTDTAFTPTQGQRVKLTSAMKSGVLSTYNFSRTTTSLTYTGTTGATLRIAVSMVFSQGNNNQIKVYIAKNGTPIDQSTAMRSILKPTSPLRSTTSLPSWSTQRTLLNPSRFSPSTLPQ